MRLNGVSMGFTEKKVSKSAVSSMILGIELLVVHGAMIILSIVKKGNLPLAAGVVESYLLLLSIFGILWAVMSYDEEKTVDRYKAVGIVVNVIALFLSLFVMAAGMMTYEI